MAEFAAFFLMNGNIRIGEKHTISLTMESENSATARKMFTLAKEFGLKREIIVYRREKLRRNQVFLLHIPAQQAIRDFLNILTIIDEDQIWELNFPGNLPTTLLENDCCKRAYLRGAFLAAGSASNPGGSYHLEIDRLAVPQAELIKDLMHGFGIEAKMTKRKNAMILYLKDGEQISKLLNIMGSHRSLLEFENIRIEKEIRNQANRLMNCDTANINKVLEASKRQVADIHFIEETLGLKKLPRPLSMVAELRLEYPETALTELSAISGLGRSAINHRLRRLSEIAANIRDFGVESWNNHE